MRKPTRQFTVRLGIFCLMACLLLLAMPSVLSDQKSAAQTSEDLSGVRVAVYNGGPFEWGNSSRTALRFMFQWMGATADLVNPAAIRTGALADYDIVAMPGIGTDTYLNELNAEGMNQIRQFVANGGSYVGICGGSVFGMRGLLGLFNGSIRTPIPGVPDGRHLTQMNVNLESSGPDLADLPATFQVLYWGSGYWYADDMSGVITVASYPTNSQPGMIAGRYGYGTYFLSSPHPEWEEGDLRDGTTYPESEEPSIGSDLDSEWPLLLRVACWLVDASPAPPPPGPNLGLIAVAAVGVAVGAGAVVALVLILKRR